jgi:hypothetical protein
MLGRSQRFATLFACLLGTASLGCHRQKTEPQTETILLEGAFEQAAKPVEGQAQIVRRGDGFELRLRRVRVTSSRPVRVYLVGAERASTTRSVISAELKYDMDELHSNQTEQTIALPSEPDPALRSVVLWDPEYSVNLGFAALRQHAKP